MVGNLVEYEARMDSWAEEQALLAELAKEQVQECIECGREIDAFTPLGWAEQGLCSGGCWASLHGEYE